MSFPHLGYYEQCGNEHRSAGISLRYWFHFLKVHTNLEDIILSEKPDTERKIVHYLTSM